MPIDWEKPHGKDWELYEATVLACDAFGRHAAPLTFTWLGWCVVLAGVRFAEVKTHLWPFKALTWILMVLLWAYFMTFISSTRRAEWLSRSEALSISRASQFLISILATAGLVGASYWLASVFMRYPL